MQIPFLLHLCFHMYPNISYYQQAERTYLIRLRWGAVCFQFSTLGPVFLNSSSKIWFAHRTVLINLTNVPSMYFSPSPSLHFGCVLSQIIGRNQNWRNRCPYVTRITIWLNGEKGSAEKTLLALQAESKPIHDQRIICFKRHQHVWKSQTR